MRRAQEVAEVEAVMRRENSWVVVDHDGTPHVKFGAMILCFRRSPWAWPLAPLMAWAPFAWLGRRAYEWVATHRHEAADATRAFAYRPLAPAGGAAAALGAVVLASLVAAQLVGGVGARPRDEGALVAVAGRALGIQAPLPWEAASGGAGAAGPGGVGRGPVGASRR